MFDPPQNSSNGKEPHTGKVKHQTSSEKSGASSRNEDFEAIERGSLRDDEEDISPEDRRTGQSLDLKRTASNALSRVASRLTTRSIVNPPPPPDGGTKAWTQVAMGWLVIFTTWGWVNSYGAFQSYYTLSLGLPASTISWIGSVQNFLTFFIGAFSGRLLDAGLFVPTLMVGAVIQILGIFFMSLSTKYWQLMITQGIMVSQNTCTQRPIAHTPLLSCRLVLEVACSSRLAWG